VDYANAKKKSPYSMDANLLHISYEGDLLEDPWVEPEEEMWRWSVSPEAAPDEPTYIELDFERGDIVAIDGQAMSPATVLEQLNSIGGANGIGRDDIVENRYVGMKSRGCYETPGGTIMLKAHRAIESLTLDREVAHLKDELMPKGNVMVVGRQSADSLFDEHIATFEEDAGAYDQADAEGFIKLNALRMRIAANRGRSPL
jgi:argininosuccinate synthase